MKMSFYTKKNIQTGKWSKKIIEEIKDPYTLTV